MSKRNALRAIAGRRSIATFTLPDIHCASCVWLLEQLWRFDAGVNRAEVDLQRRTIRIEFRPSATSLRRLAEQLASLGYEPAIDGERASNALPAARRRLYLQIGVAGFAFGNIMLFSIPRYAKGSSVEGGFQTVFDVLNVLCALPVLMFSAADYFRTGWKALRARTVSIEVPVALGLAVLVARSMMDIASGRGPGFLDSFSGLVFFLLLGRLFQMKTFDRLAFDRTVQVVPSARGARRAGRRARHRAGCAAESRRSRRAAQARDRAGRRPSARRRGRP